MTVTFLPSTEVVHLRDQHDVRIDRTTEWGNPYRIGEHGDRMTVIRRFEARAREWPQWKKDRAVQELRGKRIACWCHPLPCHGHVLARLLEEWAE